MLLAPTWDRTARQYEGGRFEPILSGLTAGHALAEQVLTEVSSGLARTRAQLTRNLQRSLAAHQQRLPSLDRTVDQMIDAGMLVEVADEGVRGPGAQVDKAGSDSRATDACAFDGRHVGARPQGGYGRTPDILRPPPSLRSDERLRAAHSGGLRGARGTQQSARGRTVHAPCWHPNRSHGAARAQGSSTTHRDQDGACRSRLDPLWFLRGCR